MSIEWLILMNGRYSFNNILMLGKVIYMTKIIKTG